MLHEASLVLSFQKINLLESRGEYYFLITHAVSLPTAARSGAQNDAISPFACSSYTSSAAQMLEWFKDGHFSCSFCLGSCSASRTLHCALERHSASPGFSVFNNHVLDLQDCKGATPEFTVYYLCWSELLSIIMELYKSNFAGTILLQTYFIPNWNENKDEVHY